MHCPTVLVTITPQALCCILPRTNGTYIADVSIHNTQLSQRIPFMRLLEYLSKVDTLSCGAESPVSEIVHVMYDGDLLLQIGRDEPAPDSASYSMLNGFTFCLPIANITSTISHFLQLINSALFTISFSFKDDFRSTGLTSDSW